MEIINEKTYNITVDPRPQSSKPGEDEKETITKNLTLVTGLTINQFSKIVSPPFSYSWSGGIFDGYRSNASWTSQSVIALDFDNTIKIEDLLPRCKEFGLIPQVWYKTFSYSSEELKYRLVFFLDQPISDQRFFEFIILSLLKLFPEADPVCKDPSRFFFGGIESNIISIEPISTSQFIDALSINIISHDSNSCRKIPLDIEYYTSLSTAEKWDLLYNNYRNVLFSANTKISHPTSNRGGAKTIIDFNAARKQIKILDEFLDGRWLYHMELFGLATNLIHIKGGMKLLKSTMEKYNKLGKTKYNKNSFNTIVYVNKVKYYPQPIYKFSPFEEDNGLLDVISTVKERRGQIEILEPIKKISLYEAEQILKSNIDDIINNGEIGKIYLMKLPTAIGKTESLLNKSATIALPTSALKNEIAGRMKVEYNMTPDPVKFSDDKIIRKIQHYYHIGVPKKAMEIIYHVANPQNAGKYSVDDIARAEEYVQYLEEAKNSDKTILTTHKRALFTEFAHDTLIFDEDPLTSLLEIQTMKISDLFGLRLIANSTGIKYVVDELTNANPSVVSKTPTFLFDVDDIIEKVAPHNIGSNIFSFLESSYYVRDRHNPDIIYYVVKRNLPKNKKVVILSATIPTYIYKELFGDRVKVIDITDVEQQGTIIQYTNRSCSRDGLKRYGKDISDKVGDLPTITFKSMRKNFQNPVIEMYFGNCSGYDLLKGQDIAVVGTPHRNEAEYMLTAKVIDPETKTSFTSMSVQEVEFNGFRYKFNTFINEEHRNIQLSLIESDLIQAAGRARTLRTNATVHLYSNFPLRISTNFRY
ncbi:hypothetical protein INQ51_17135 [Maribellus sp. CM-23]|uniref:hypothetical protein n=1 Tax=Maribellus sp. CM-23 TaxID=2781026 RepID=UPI001F31971A|nr:hypothetical protein [Maribellus sp. CM-23]MCE4566047.1 hypothetical protein [Maribellus sp. CM-23]